MCKEFDDESDDRACQYLRRLVDEIHTVVLATMGYDGYPHTCAVDMMLADRHGVYFLTARGKSLYSRLRATGRVSLTGIRGDTTMTSIAVTLTGDVEEVPERLGELLEANPYMYRIYPTEESRRALTAFRIVRGEGEFFDLSARPIVRDGFSFGGFGSEETGYSITDTCDGCRACLESCPQSCIDTSTVPFRIVQENCLRCGNCMESCHKGAVSAGRLP